MRCIWHVCELGKMGRPPSLAPADQGSMTDTKAMRARLLARFPPSSASTTQALPTPSQDQLSGCSLCTASARPSEDITIWRTTARHPSLLRGTIGCVSLPLLRRLSRLGKAARSGQPSRDVHKPAACGVDINCSARHWSDTGKAVSGLRVAVARTGSTPGPVFPTPTSQPTAHRVSKTVCPNP
jgi:hypothetical protein